MGNDLTKHLGTIEYMRNSREMQLIETNGEFTEIEKEPIKKYLRWKMKQAEKIMNPTTKQSYSTN